MQPTVVTIAQRTVRIGDDVAVVINPNGVTINVAVDAEPKLATEEFLRTLNGGSPPAIVPLTSSELDYLIAMNGAGGRLSLNTNDVYTSLEVSALSPRESALAFVDGSSMPSTRMRQNSSRSPTSGGQRRPC